MNKEEIKIITLGDIFRNLETEEQAFEFLKYIKNLQQENKQLKDNWNKLKEYLNYKSERAVGEDEYVYDEIYNEMQEIEKGSGINDN